MDVFLFDLDDTLIDTKIYAQLYEPILRLIVEKRELTGKSLDKKAAEFGLTKNKYGRWDTGDLCRELGLLAEYYEELEKMIEMVPVLRDSVLDVFSKLREKKKKIGVVSNSMRRTIELYLQKYNLLPFVDFIFSQNDAGCRKNDPVFWKKLIQKEKLNPEESLVVGDDPIEDGEIPRSLGFKTFLIKSSESLRDLQKIITFEI
ncbi:HAD family hydrolase [Candidatus Woesearchaeota archaeon]|nr:HAD family hydrolase [Candidatus Woesearchaeota archaeon]